MFCERIEGKDEKKKKKRWKSRDSDPIRKNESSELEKLRPELEGGQRKETKRIG